MARLVYSCRFALPEEAQPLDLLDEYSIWLSDWYARQGANQTIDLLAMCAPKFEFAPPIDGHELTLERHEHDRSSVWILNWRFPGAPGLFIHWLNTATIALVDNQTSLTHTIQIETADYYLAPVYFDVGSPKIVRALCEKHEIKVGAMRVRAQAYPLALKDVDEFVTLLTSTDRRLPIVFLTPYAGGEPCELHGGRLAQRLAGVAIIVVAEDVDVTWELGRRIGKWLNCFDGGVRIYWPGFDPSHSPRRHPLFPASRTEWHGVEHIQRLIQRTVFAVTTFRHTTDPNVLAIINASRAAKLERRHEGARGDADEAWRLAFELDAQLSQLRAQITTLEDENANLRAQPVVFNPSANELAGEDEELSDDEPESVIEALQLAKRTFNRLIVLDSAERSAQKSRYRGHTKVFRALKALHDVAELAYPSESAPNNLNWEQELKQRCALKRYSEHLSNIALTKYKSDYMFQYNGTSTLFEPHITLGAGDPNSCASIHFIREPATGKVVIAHVGKHLTNTRS